MLIRRPFSALIATTSLLLGTSLALAAEKNQYPSINWYGKLHLSADYLDTDQKGHTGQAQISSNASRLGVRGDYTIDERIKLLYQIESAANIADGEWKLNRNSFLGATGDWGTLKAGIHDSPFKQVRGKVDFFGSEVGDARNALGIHGSLDRRLKRSVLYESPSLAGFTIKTQYTANNKDSDTQTTATRVFSSSVEYQYRGLWLGLAHENTGKESGENKEITLNGNTINLDSAHQKATRFAASYDFGRIKIAALYQQIKDDLRTTQGFGGGAKLKLNEKWTLKTQAYRYRADHGKSKADLFALGTEYRYSKQLGFYLNTAILDNKDNIEAATPFKVGRSATPKIDFAKDPKAINASPYAVSLGVIFDF